MARKNLTWSLEPHTRAKHEILRRYLEAWSAILGLSRADTIAYVDGFAGPGVYDKGEDGSPIIALKAALSHEDKIKSEIRFLFIEKDIGRARHLEGLVASLNLPARFRTRVTGGLTFEDGFRQHLIDPYKRHGMGLPPTFAFIDPFGWKGVPFALVKEILANPSCEVFVNFMFEEINRFIKHEDQPNNFDELFGTSRWRGVLSITDIGERRNFLHGLYLSQLRDAAGARYVRSFEMRNKNDATDYFLFFATNSRKGIEKMKEAMWKVDESGEFRFSDATNPAQVLLFEKQPDFLELRRQLLARFGGKTVTVGEVEEFVLAETSFRETHYKKRLAELEDEGQLVAVNPPTSRRKRSYPDPLLVLRFLAPAT
ncbi:MAG: three-Cys-motif partner protein TcmP [Myxococcales bacterium]|nr:three-Cys-motif partner protein TcmP [Myxococcales bacterium]